MASKPTKRDMFEAIMELAEDNADIVAFAAHEIELLDKRAAAPRKPSKNAEANEVIKSNVVKALDSMENGATATELANAEDVSVQRMSQLLRQLIAEGFVTKVEAKGKEKARFLSV